MPISSGSSNNEVSLLPAPLNLKIYRGDSFDVIFTVKDKFRQVVDLTGWAGLVQFRDASDNIIATPTVVVNNDDELGAIRVYLLDTSDFTVGSYSYDFQLTDLSGRKRTYFAGSVIVSGDISR